jgi:uncharacterized protein YecE (DUF72 family)
MKQLRASCIVTATVMQAWVGTSGYSYADWVGGFYPSGTRSAKMLSHYSRYFPLVELNFTFYRRPTAAMLARLARQTPAGFQFIVKLPRSLSHEESDRELQPFRSAVDELHRRGQLLGLLCQMPQAVHNQPHHRAWLERLAAELGSYHLATEFRHRSWFHPEIPSWLREKNVDLVAVDVPDLPGLYPRGFVQSTPRVYIRFHSRNSENWYRSDKDRYDYDYQDDALEEWMSSLRRFASQTERVLLLFNNCQRSQAAENARRMQTILSKYGAGIDVVEPFAMPRQEPKQRLLFE